tara:strand:+ start:628 stop:876 length:249 start_codon:yes stop_codon:yes gene_type:complete
MAKVNEELLLILEDKSANLDTVKACLRCALQQIELLFENSKIQNHLNMESLGALKALQLTSQAIESDLREELINKPITSPNS